METLGYVITGLLIAVAMAGLAQLVYEFLNGEMTDGE